MATMQEDDVAVACADCPACGEENLVARVASVSRIRFTSTVQHKITCRHCQKTFKFAEHKLLIRRKPREEVKTEYPAESHLWI